MARSLAVEKVVRTFFHGLPGESLQSPRPGGRRPDAPPPANGAMSETLLETPLVDWHVAHGGRMVGFAGWRMPVQYRSIVEEHVAARAAAGIFDVSHMGRLAIRGPAAIDWLESLLTRRVAGLPVGRVRYTLITADRGNATGLLDPLKRTERHRRRGPAVEPHDQAAAAVRLGRETLVRRHVGRTVGGLVPPDMHGGHGRCIPRSSASCRRGDTSGPGN